jgi:type III secretory pathway component EscR
MPLIYPVFIRNVLHRLVGQRFSIELRQSLITLCFFLLLSFFTTIVTNIILPFLIFQNSPSSSPSSSLSLLTSNHIFFPTGLTSSQYSQQQHHELQAQFQGQELSGKKRQYTKDLSQQKNVSSGKLNFLRNFQKSKTQWINFFLRESNEKIILDLTNLE